MEEDIKKLEKYLKGEEIYDTELDNALRNLISSYKKLKEENKTNLEHIQFWHNSYNEAIDNLHRIEEETENLKHNNKTLEELLQGRLYELYKYYRELAGQYQGACVPKSVIEEKIKELSNEYEYLAEENKRVNKFEIELLQELLEKGNSYGRTNNRKINYDN